MKFNQIIYSLPLAAILLFSCDKEETTNNVTNSKSSTSPQFDLVISSPNYTTGGQDTIYWQADDANLNSLTGFTYQLAASDASGSVALQIQDVFLTTSFQNPSVINVDDLGQNYGSFSPTARMLSLSSVDTVNRTVAGSYRYEYVQFFQGGMFSMTGSLDADFSNVPY